MTLSLGFQSEVSLTRPNNTTAYGALDAIGIPAGDGTAAGSAILEFADIAPPGGGLIKLVGIDHTIYLDAIPSTMAAHRLHLYNAAPGALLDNAVWKLIAADRSKYLGFIDIATTVDYVDTLFVQNDGLAKQVKALSSSLFAILITVPGFDPVASIAHRLRLNSVRL
jgi:hypothetical protein